MKNGCQLSIQPYMKSFMSEFCMAEFPLILQPTFSDSSNFFLFFSFFFFLRAALVAYIGSQAMRQIGAAAAGLCHRHSKTGSELHLRPIPQLTAMLDP